MFQKLETVTTEFFRFQISLFNVFALFYVNLKKGFKRDPMNIMSSKAINIIFNIIEVFF